jgi:hypothetical protein
VRGAAVLLLVVLGAGGAGLGGLPQVRKLLPEATVLDRLDGKIIHVDANDTWLFELERDVNSVDVRMPAGTRLVLLPSATLGKLIADMNDRAGPQYRLTVRVTQYQGRNYLIPTYFLPLSKLKSDETPEDGGQRTENSGAHPPSAIPKAQSGGPELTIPPEILQQLENRRPLRAPSRSPRPDEEPAPDANHAPAPAERMLVDCVGRMENLRDEAGGTGDTRRHAPRPAGHAPSYVFVPYALGWNLSKVRYELLPSGVLEQALQRQAGSLERMRFNVAGLVTEFRGRKYLLLQRAVPVYSYGDFGR